LIRSKPESAIMISESGIRTRVEMDELKGLGFDGFLIGETLMRQDDPEVELKKWLQAAPLPVR
jgi:indole-3-glycerol phosphate synthase